MRVQFQPETIGSEVACIAWTSRMDRESGWPVGAIAFRRAVILSDT